MSPYAFVGFFLGLVVVFSFRARARRRKGKAEASRVRLSILAEQRREAARGRLLSYQGLVRGLSAALGSSPDDAWSRFSEGFLRLGHLHAGLAAAFGGDRHFANFDWRDLEGFQEFAERVNALCGRAPPFAFDPGEHEVPVEAGIRLLGRWLESHDQALLYFGPDTDSYSCVVLAREAAQTILSLRPDGDEPVHGLRVELLR